MVRFVIVVALVSLLAAGCNREPREPPVPATHNYDLFGGRYFVDIETVGSFAMSNTAKNGQVDGQTYELAEYKWQGNTLRIDHGRLTYNGKDSGTLQPGDRVRVDKDAHLFVNGKPQP